MARNRRKKKEIEEEIPEEEVLESEEADEEVDLDDEEEADDEPSGRRSGRNADHGGRRGRDTGSTVGSGKSQGTALILNLFLGWLGADRFYTGRIGLGIGKLLCSLVLIVFFFLKTMDIGLQAPMAYAVMLFAAVLLGTFQIYDFILIGMGRMRDKEGELLARPGADKANPNDRYQGRAFLLTVFGGFVGQGRFYLGNKTFGGIKIGVFVLSIILLIIASPRWQGFHKYDVTYKWTGTLKRHQLVINDPEQLLAEAEAPEEGGEGDKPKLVDYKKIMDWRSMELKDSHEKKVLEFNAAVTNRRLVVIAYPNEDDREKCVKEREDYWKQVMKIFPLPRRDIAKLIGLDIIVNERNPELIVDGILSEITRKEEPHDLGASINTSGEEEDAGPVEGYEIIATGGQEVEHKEGEGEEEVKAATKVEDDGTAPILERTVVTFPFTEIDHSVVLNEKLAMVKERMLKGITGNWVENSEKSLYTIASGYVNQFPLKSNRDSDDMLWVALACCGICKLLWLIDILLIGMGSTKDAKGNTLSLDPVFATVHCEECGEIMVVDLRQANLTNMVCRYEECGGYCLAPDQEVIEEIEKHRDSTLPHTVMAIASFVGTVILGLAAIFLLASNSIGSELAGPNIDQAQQVLIFGAFVLFVVTLWQMISGELKKPICEF